MNGICQDDDDEKSMHTDDVRQKLLPFSKLVVSPDVRKGIERMKIKYPTVTQSIAIPLGRRGFDMVIQSKSGTGKTLIFGALVLEAYDSKLHHCQSLVVTPTREIALQIETELRQMSKYCNGYKVISAIGGKQFLDDRRRLTCVKTVVGTPGRILHLIISRVIRIEHLQLLVLDEADVLFAKNFRKDVLEILSLLPEARQMITCSATYTPRLEAQLSQHMLFPLRVSMENSKDPLIGLRHFVIDIVDSSKDPKEMELKSKILSRIFATVLFQQCIIFAGSQARVSSFHNHLEIEGWPCNQISAALPQNDRADVFKKVRNGRNRIILTTDLLSRGVDAMNLNMVINLDMPTDIPTYMHRVGRAGRFGGFGVIINIVNSHSEREFLENFLVQTKDIVKLYNFPTPDEETNAPNGMWDFFVPTLDFDRFGCYNVRELTIKKGILQPLPLATSTENVKVIPPNGIDSVEEKMKEANTFLFKDIKIFNDNDNDNVTKLETDFIDDQVFDNDYTFRRCEEIVSACRTRTVDVLGMLSNKLKKSQTQQKEMERSEAEPEPRTADEAEGEVKVEIVAEAAVNVEAEVNSEVKAAADDEVNAEASAVAEAGVNAEAEVNSEVKAAAIDEVNAEASAVAEAAVNAEAEVNSEAKAAADDEVNDEASAVAEAVVNVNAEADGLAEVNAENPNSMQPNAFELETNLYKTLHVKRGELTKVLHSLRNKKIDAKTLRAIVCNDKNVDRVNHEVDSNTVAEVLANQMEAMNISNDLVAPLASSDNISLNDNSDVVPRAADDSDSQTIDTQTFLIDSQDSAVNVIAGDQNGLKNDVQDEVKHDVTSCSRPEVSHEYPSSNTIDDASSITVDSASNGGAQNVLAGELKNVGEDLSGANSSPPSTGDLSQVLVDFKPVNVESCNGNVHGAVDNVGAVDNDPECYKTPKPSSSQVDDMLAALLDGAANPDASKVSNSTETLANTFITSLTSDCSESVSKENDTAGCHYADSEGSSGGTYVLSTATPLPVEESLDVLHSDNPPTIDTSSGFCIEITRNNTPLPHAVQSLYNLIHEDFQRKEKLNKLSVTGCVKIDISSDNAAVSSNNIGISSEPTFMDSSLNVGISLDIADSSTSNAAAAASASVRSDKSNIGITTTTATSNTKTYAEKSTQTATQEHCTCHKSEYVKFGGVTITRTQYQRILDQQSSMFEVLMKNARELAAAVNNDNNKTESSLNSDD